MDNPLRFILSKINEIEEFFIVAINDRVKISNTINKYITALGYSDKTLLVLTDPSIFVCICSMTLLHLCNDIAAVMGLPKCF